MAWNSIRAQAVTRKRRTGEINCVVIMFVHPIQACRTTWRMLVQVIMMRMPMPLMLAVRVPMQRQVDVRSNGMVVWLVYAAARMRMGQRLHQQERENQQQRNQSAHLFLWS